MSEQEEGTFEKIWSLKSFAGSNIVIIIAMLNVLLTCTAIEFTSHWVVANAELSKSPTSAKISTCAMGLPLHSSSMCNAGFRVVWVVSHTGH